MRKFLLVVTAVLGLATVSCKSDDNNSLSGYEKDLQGTWKQSRVLYLDKNDKIVDEEVIEDYGCGIGEIEFKGNTLIVRSFDFGMNGKCEKDEEKKNYYIKGDMIYEEKATIGNQIIELTKNRFVVKEDMMVEDDFGLATFGETVDVEDEVVSVYLEFVR